MAIEGIRLIEAQEVIDIAFPGSSTMRPENISDAVIHICEVKYIQPAFGAELFAALFDKYRDFADEFVKPALAYFVKCELIPSLSMQFSNGGVAVAAPQYMTAATDKQRVLLYESELGKAQTLLDEAVRYVENNLVNFPEYDTKTRRTINHKVVGGIIL